MDDLDVGRGVVIPGEELELRFSRSGGPGGQNVNRRATKVEVIFDLANSAALTADQRRRATARLRSRIDARGRLHVVAQEERSQAQNRARAVETLARLLGDALRPPPPPRRPTKPTKTAKEKRLASKRQRARTKRERARPDDD
jgi:ribosome-associated protein